MTLNKLLDKKEIDHITILDGYGTAVYKGTVTDIPDEYLDRDVQSQVNFSDSLGVFLTETDEEWDAFVKMVRRYKMMGVRMVCFDNPENIGGSWIMAFYTHGVNADEIPTSRFDVPAVRRWTGFYACGMPVDVANDVTHFDVTDDFYEMCNYDHDPRSFKVLQLA